jgi:hypothetical protein
MGKTPLVIVNGFGPLYKKYGALKTFAHAMITQQDMTIPETMYIADVTDADFFSTWLTAYGIKVPQRQEAIGSLMEDQRFIAHFPPTESEITDLVHGDIEISDSAEELRWHKQLEY